MFKNVTKRAPSFVLGLFGLAVSQNAFSKIFIDTVVDPLPLVEFQVIIPKGSLNSDLKNFAIPELFELMVDSGTKNKNKQQFQDELAKFGANYSINIGAQFTYISVEFPYIESKNYEELFSLVKEALFEPKLDEASLKLSKSKLKSSMVSMLDKDSALVQSFIRNWQYYKIYNKKPLTIEDVDLVDVKSVSDFYFNKVLKAENIWIGFVTPPAVKETFAKMISNLFQAQGEMVHGQFLESMASEHLSESKLKPSKTFFVIDKKDRTQNVFTVNALLPSKFKSGDELEFRMGNYVLVGAGFGSTFMDVIRTQNGFAYYVSPFETKLNGQPTFGFSTNPVASRSIQAFKTISDLMNEYYQNTKTAFKKYKNDFWSARLQSFKYSEMLERSSEIKKLDRRRLVILGEITPEYYRDNPKDWKLDIGGVAKTYDGLYSKSMVVAAAIGDAESLESIVKLNFQDFEVVNISAKDVITAKPYK